MIPTSVFPNLVRIYPNLKIIGVKQAWKVGFGWSLNVYTALPVLSQIRTLKENGFTTLSLTLKNEKTKVEFQTDFQISELSFCRPIRKKHRYGASYIYVKETNLHLQFNGCDN
jgi:hypothetical protein